MHEPGTADQKNFFTKILHSKLQQQQQERQMVPLQAAEVGNALQQQTYKQNMLWLAASTL